MPKNRIYATIPVKGTSGSYNDWKPHHPGDLVITKKKVGAAGTWEGNLYLLPGCQILRRVPTELGDTFVHLIALPLEQEDFDRIVKDGTWINRVFAIWYKDGPTSVDKAVDRSLSDGNHDKVHYLAPQSGETNLADDIIRLAASGERLLVPSKPNGGFEATFFHQGIPRKGIVTWVGIRTAVAHNGTSYKVVVNLRLVTADLKAAIENEKVVMVPDSFSPYTLETFEYGVIHHTRRRRRR